MSMSAITFNRDTTPGMIERGWRIRSCSTPSMRIADAQIALGRLDVDVGGSFVDGLHDDQVHELDDRRFLDDGAQRGEVLLLVEDVVDDDLGDVVDFLVELAAFVEQFGQLRAR